MNTEPWHLGKYELLECLGHGGMAEVWKAVDTELQRYVAIKFLHANLRTDRDFMMRFIREAQAIASLRHPHIVQVHDFHAPQAEELQMTSQSQISNMAYMVMEYVQGPTLAEYMLSTSHQRLFPPATEIVHLFASISNAIDYAHQHNMLHRDIKPANILLDTRRLSRYQMGEPILTDFSIVKLLGMSNSTAVGTLLGTPLYMAPEQAQGQPGNKASDIYSLGIILYEICTGVQPFRGDNPSAILFQHIYTAPVSPVTINPAIPPTLSEVILRSLAKDPAARFPSASALADALATTFNLSHTPELSRTASPVSETPSIAAEQLNQAPFSPAPPAATSLSSVPTVSPPTQPREEVSQASTQVERSHTPTTPAYITPTVRPRSSDIAPAAIPQPPALSHTEHITPLGAVKPSSSWLKRRRGMGVASLVLLILLLAGIAPGAFSLLTHKSSSPGNPANALVGYALFASSGEIADLNNNNINDELEMNLHNIATPQSGKVYYAWLLSDKKAPSQPPLLLGKLSVEHGTVTFSYSSNQLHVNLLKDYSQLFITLESENASPGTPSSDRSSWRYYASLPQTPDGTLTNSSAVDYLRHLLVADPQTQSGRLQTAVGIDIQFLRNIQQVLAEATSATSAWYSKDTSSLHNHLIRLLDYLDGTYVQQDTGSTVPLLVDSSLIQTPLLDITQFDGLGSYFTRFPLELNNLINAPGVTAEMRILARAALTAFPAIQTQLEQVRNEAKTLFKLSNAQLLQPSTLDILHTMVVQASRAYNQTNPSTNQPQGGAIWIHAKIQRLATFEIYPFKQ